MLGLRALEEGEAQLEARRGEINSAGVNPGWSDSGLPHREPSTWGGFVWGVSKGIRWA